LAIDLKPLGRAAMMRLAEQSPRVAELAPEREARVRQWVWTRAYSERWWLEPLFGARVGVSAGRDFGKPPRRLRGAEKYGYDEDGHLVFSVRYVDESRYEAQAIEYDGGVALARTYASDVTRRLVRLVRTVHDDQGRVVLAEHASPGSGWMYARETFDYDAAGRLQSVEFERSDPEARVPTAPDLGRGVQRLSYVAGELASVVEEYRSGRPSRIVYAPSPGDPAEIGHAALAGVLDAVRTAVAQVRHDEPMCMLALRYVAGVPLPPTVDLCPDSLWERLAASEDPYYALNPAEWRTPEVVLDLDDETRAACDRLERLDAKPDLARELTRAAAAVLQGEDWTTRRTVTDDFLVYAVDMELTDLEANHPPAELPARQSRLWD
jgi:hypothetical protein